jgi:hypothetical protein
MSLLSPRSMTLALALALGLAPIAKADPETAFTRFKDGAKENHGALQIAQATYKKAGSDVEIVLYGVVHIADKAYFDLVQKDLDAYDCVLWEGVKPGKKKDKPDEGMINIGEMQKAMCELMSLTFQKDGINYDRDHFVWADMDMDQLDEAFGADAEKGLPGANMFNSEMMKSMGPMMKMGLQFAKFLFKSNPEMQNNMKRMFAQQLAGAGTGGAMPGMDPKFQEVILVKRNEVVMKFLDEQLAKTDKGSIAIFYGAAHMPDFHERLAKMGYKQVSKSWKSAWTIGDGVADEGRTETPAKPAKPVKPARPGKSGEKRWF